MNKVIAEAFPEATKDVFNNDPMKVKFGNVGGVISAILPYIYVAAGLAMFVMLILGGLGLMTSSGDPGKMQAGYGKIKAGLIGFFLVFLSYAIVQLLQTVLGIEILGGGTGGWAR